MGRDKATLAFGRETLLERTVRIVAGCVDEVVVVARRDQTFPPMHVAVAVGGGVAHPLCAVYRATCAATIDRFVAENRFRATDLVEALNPVRVDEAELRAVDPELLALTNCNTPEAYAAALARLARDGA